MRNYFKNQGFGFMSIETFRKIFQSGIPYAIKLNWRGEPLLHKDLCTMIRYAKFIGVQEVLLNTNGLLVDRDMALALADAGLDWLIISVDGATKETYESIRIGGDWETLYNNITRIHMIYSRIKKHPKVRLQICKQPANEHEINLWKETFSWFSDNLRIGKLFNPQGEADWETIQPKSCKQLWQRLVVDWQGNIHPCCSDFNGRFVLGNINDKTIKDMWKSPQMNYWRYNLKHYGRKHTSLCQKCSSYC